MDKETELENEELPFDSKKMETQKNEFRRNGGS